MWSLAPLDGKRPPHPHPPSGALKRKKQTVGDQQITVGFNKAATGKLDEHRGHACRHSMLAMRQINCHTPAACTGKPALPNLPALHVPSRHLSRAHGQSAARCRRESPHGSQTAGQTGDEYGCTRALSERGCRQAGKVCMPLLPPPLLLLRPPPARQQPQPPPPQQQQSSCAHLPSWRPACRPERCTPSRAAHGQVHGC